MVKIGYIRVSGQDQNLDRQVALLNQLKIDKLFQEKASGKDCNRPEFQKLLNYIREGDCVVVASLDRLGRNYEDIKQTVAFMKQKNVSLQILDAPFLNFNTGYKGRPTEYAPNSKNPQKRLVYQTVVKQLKQGDTVAEIATENGLSRPTVYKIKKANNL